MGRAFLKGYASCLSLWWTELRSGWTPCVPGHWNPTYRTWRDCRLSLDVKEGVGEGGWTWKGGEGVGRREEQGEEGGMEEGREGMEKGEMKEGQWGETRSRQ